MPGSVYEIRCSEGRSHEGTLQGHEAQDRAVKHLLTPKPPRTRPRTPSSVWLWLLVAAACAALSVHPTPARPLGASVRSLGTPTLPLGGSIALGLSIPSRSAGGPGQIYAADAEGIAARTPARKSATELATLRTPRRTGLAGAWDSVRSSAFARRLERVSSWVSGGVRLLWSIPKAVIQGDSSALIEAIGNLLAGAPGEQDKTVELPQVQPDPDPSGEPRQDIVH